MLFPFISILKYIHISKKTALMDAQKLLYEKQFQIQREHESIQKENHRFMKKYPKIFFNNSKINP